MVINIDFDNTIVDTVSILLDNLNKLYGKKYTNKNYYNYNCEKLYKDLATETVDKLFDSNGFYQSKYIYSGVKEFVSYFRKNNTIRLVTVASLDNYKNKVEFLFNNNIIMHEFKKCSKNKSKIDMSGQILIDDKIDELRNSNATVKILFKACGDKEWNKTEPYDDVYIAYDWHDVYNIVKFFIEEDDFYEEI